MKVSLLAFSLLLSSLAYSQVRPGTGPNNNTKSYPEIEADLASTLTENSVLCGKKQTNYQNLIDVHLKFGVIEQLARLKQSAKVIECEQDNITDVNMRCLFTSGPAQDQLEEVLKDKWQFTRHYQIEHKLTEKESETLYNFFVKVQKEVNEPPKGK